jgi:hypothetical protein
VYNVVDRRHTQNLQKNQEDAAKPSLIDKLSISLVSFAMLLSISIVVYLAIVVAPEILNAKLGSLPVNTNDVYPILLQGLLIIASIAVSFFSFILNKLSELVVNLVKRLKFSLQPKVLLYLIILFLIMLLYTSLLLSIFYSINGMIYYGQLSTYITQTKAIQIPNLFRQDLPIVIMNNSYFNNSTYKNYTGPIDQTYNYLLSNAKNSVKFLFWGFAIVLILIILYIAIRFGVFDLINDIWKKRGIWSKIGLVAMFLLFLYPILYFINHVGFINYLIISLGLFVSLIIIAILNTIKIRADKKNKQNANPPI